MCPAGPLGGYASRRLSSAAVTKPESTALPAPLSARASLTARTGWLVAAGAVAVFAAWAFPRLDRILNPQAPYPGVVSYLGVGLTVLGVTALLLFVGLRALLPRGGVFLAAAFAYNAILVAIKFGLGPLSLYVADAGGYNSGFLFLTEPLAYPGVAAIAAVLYGGAFFLLYLIYRSRLQRAIGLGTGIGQHAGTLLVLMFVLAVVGGITIVGLGGFLEYLGSVLFFGVLAAAFAAALVFAIAFCSVAFQEATKQALLTRNVALIGTFAWIGLAFIAAYHVLWLVFVLTLISIWPLHAWSGK